MSAIMDDSHGNKKHEYDKIALLGLFVLSLLMAYLIVSSKSRLQFSDLIQLSKTGLSVSIPSGHGWQSDKKWNYQENVFSLSSLFPSGSERPTAWASCRYLLSAETTTPRMRFEQRASAINAVVTQINQTQTDTLTIDWARIEIKELHLNIFFGTSQLPDNRQLDIEVGQIAGEVELVERIFKHILESLKFKNNRLLKDGAEIVTEMKRKGLDSFLKNQNKQTYFLIKDDMKRNIGFTMDVIINTGIDSSVTGDQPNIRAAGQFYIRGQSSVEHATSFQCSNNLDEFIYKSKTLNGADASGAETTLDKNGIISIRTFQKQPDENSYRLGPAMIPDVFLDQLLMQMLESEKDQIVVDIIEATGKIIPTHLVVIETKEDSAADEGAAYIFELKLLDGRGFSEQLYLNNQKQIYKRLAHQDQLYTLEYSGAEKIAEEFPEYSERILRNDRLLR